MGFSPAVPPLSTAVFSENGTAKFSRAGRADCSGSCRAPGLAGTSWPSSRARHEMGRSCDGTDFARITLEQGEPAEDGTDVRLLGEGYATLTVLQPIRAAGHVAIPTQRAAETARQET
jgi:hypothetical protein